MYIDLCFGVGQTLQLDALLILIVAQLRILYTHIHTYMCKNVCMYVCTVVYVFVLYMPSVFSFNSTWSVSRLILASLKSYVRVYVCMYVCMYACMYVYATNKLITFSFAVAICCNLPTATFPSSALRLIYSYIHTYIST